jgi:hypothetical protein
VRLGEAVLAEAAQLAKDALYDAAAFALQRSSQQQTTFELTLTPNQPILPGDTVYLRIKDTLRLAENPDMGRYRDVSFVDVDAAFWVLEASEDVSASGASVSLVVSSVDRAREDAGRALVGVISDVRTQRVIVKQTLNHHVVGPEQVVLDASNPATVRFPVGDYTQSFVNARLRLLTRPFTATSKAGPHRHMMFKFIQSGGDGQFIPIGTFRAYSTYTDEYPVLCGVRAPSFDLFTYGDEAETLYEIQRDTLRPAGISISVNGVSIASGIGATDADLDASYNVTDALNGRSGGVQGVHTISLTCASGQGEVVMYLDILELIVAVKGN